MIYDMTIRPKPPAPNGKPGYSIHDTGSKDHRYNLYTDDGRGNGDHVCSSDNLYWVRRIAQCLDELPESEFDANGWLK